MSALDSTLYSALVAANVPEEAATNVVRALNDAIDKHYEIHSRALATRGDMESVHKRIDATNKEISDVRLAIAELKTEMIKWYLGSSIAIAGMVIAAIKLL